MSASTYGTFTMVVKSVKAFFMHSLNSLSACVCSSHVSEIMLNVLTEVAAEEASKRSAMTFIEKRRGMFTKPASCNPLVTSLCTKAEVGESGAGKPGTSTFSTFKVGAPAAGAAAAGAAGSAAVGAGGSAAVGALRQRRQNVTAPSAASSVLAKGGTSAAAFAGSDAGVPAGGAGFALC